MAPLHLVHELVPSRFRATADRCARDGRALDPHERRALRLNGEAREGDQKRNCDESEHRVSNGCAGHGRIEGLFVSRFRPMEGSNQNERGSAGLSVYGIVCQKLGLAAKKRGQ